MIYDIEIIEVLSRVIGVNANSKDEAIATVSKMYRDCEIVLDADDFRDSEIVCLDNRRNVVDVERRQFASGEAYCMVSEKIMALFEDFCGCEVAANIADVMADDVFNVMTDENLAIGEALAKVLVENFKQSKNL